jgi:hypothetical protein
MWLHECIAQLNKKDMHTNTYFKHFDKHHNTRQRASGFLAYFGEKK